MHAIGPLQSEIEKVSPEFLVGGIEKAQELGWQGVEAIRAVIRPGMTEAEATKAAQAVLTNLGSPRAWHRPLIRFGSNTTKYFSDRSDAVTLQENDIFFIDIGPTWRLDDFGGVEYESDVGNTFVMGSDPRFEVIAQQVRELFVWGSTYWKKERPTGPELYAALERETQRRGYVLMSKADGHRLSEFPHQPYSRKGFTEIDFCPSPYVWVLEVQIASADLTYGAFYEDILRHNLS